MLTEYSVFPGQPQQKVGEVSESNRPTAGQKMLFIALNLTKYVA